MLAESLMKLFGVCKHWANASRVGWGDALDICGASRAAAVWPFMPLHGIVSAIQWFLVERVNVDSLWLGLKNGGAGLRPR